MTERRYAVIDVDMPRWAIADIRPLISNPRIEISPKGLHAMDFSDAEGRIMAHLVSATEAEERQAAKLAAHDALQEAKAKTFSAPVRRSNRAARRRAEAIQRPKRPRW